jgi:hypothetical protein
MTATVIAAVAAAQAAQAKLTACESYVRGYAHDNALVEQMQKYSECISLLHPTDFSSSEVVALKIVIIFIFLCTAIGAAYGLRSEEWRGDRVAGTLLSALVGFCGSAATVLVAGLAGWAVRFLLT